MLAAATAGAARATSQGPALSCVESETRNAVWFAQLYEDTFDRIYRYAFMLVRNPARAEDVTAEVYLRAWHARDTLKDQGSAHSWLMTIAHNCAYSLLRSTRDVVDVEAVMNKPDATPDPLSDLESAATREQLRRALLHLTPEQQQVIFLRFYEGSSHEAIADRLDKKPNAVRAIQFRAINRLRKLLEGMDSHATA